MKGHDSALDAAVEASDAAGLPQIAVRPNQGRLLDMVGLLRGARRILEIGTCAVSARRSATSHASATPIQAVGSRPFGRVVSGMAVVDSLYDDYGDAPQQQLISTLGNNYLLRMFPKLDYITTARIVGDSSASR